MAAVRDQEDATMPDNVLVFYGSYRTTRIGIRMATFVINELRACGALPELIDARETGLPIIDRMYKEYPKGSAPPAMEDLAQKIRAADAFVFVVGEYNWGPQPGLKNLTDHFLEEWYWRPAAVVSYSPSRLSGVRAGSAWHPILSEMGMVVISSTVAVGPIEATLNAQGEPIGEAGRLAQKALRRLADDLAWWTSAARNQRLQKNPPY
jgi:NAD(P)H-dependent FMN reductase